LARQIARFALRASYDRISKEARERLKCSILDAIGCAFAAIGQGPVAATREHVDEFGGGKWCTLIGGGKSGPEQAAFYNGGLVCYVDFNDSFLGESGTCHPSDNLAPVLAAAEYADDSGREFLAALAAAYEVQCRLTDRLPVMKKGFDHSTLFAFAVAAGVSRALGLDEERAMNAVTISGDSALALTVTRAHPISNEATGTEAKIDWSDDSYESPTRVSLKPHNAEVHTQSTITAALALREKHGLRPADIDKVEVETFKVAFNITGGGEWGDRHDVRVKEEADHSLPYLVAVALIDGHVQPAQFAPKRIVAKDVQELLHKVSVTDRWAFSRRYPKEVPTRVTVRLRDGRSLEAEADGFEGFYAWPMSWDAVVAKFERLSSGNTSAALRGQIVEAVGRLENVRVADLAKLLGRTIVPAMRAKASRRKPAATRVRNAAA